MKVDFDAVLKDIQGKKAQRLIVKPAYRLEDGRIEPPEVEDMTLLNLSLQALQPIDNTAEVKWRTFGLRVRIVQGGVQEITAKEATEILTAIAKNFADADSFGRAKELLDPEVPEVAVATTGA